jgi:hypothetical protein
MSVPADPLRAEALLLELCQVAGLKPVLFQGALLLTKPDGNPPELLFAHLARFLRDPDPRARFAAAWGFEVLTWKSFGFDPNAPMDSRANRAAADWMVEWLQKKGSSIARDPETDRWGVQGEDWED